MSKSLTLEQDPVDQPAATDPIERLTWCAFRVRVGSQVIARIFDRRIEMERSTLYVPAFPIAEWLVQNWWVFLNEPCRFEEVPRAPLSPSKLQWIKRHCIRSADSSLLLPLLYLYNDGRNLCAVWRSDSEGSLPNMPGSFMFDGEERIDENGTRESLADFINATLDRVSGVGDARVHELRNDWQAIQSAGAEEERFCTVAGRMGIDPYDPDIVTDELARFLEGDIFSADSPPARDLTEVATAGSVAEQWSWIDTISRDLGLGPTASRVTVNLPPTAAPPQFGYNLAREIRKRAGLSPRDVLDSVEATAGAVLGARFRADDRNHVPSGAIRAIVGQSGADVVAAGPLPVREDNRRFHLARSFYHALATTEASYRLVTNAFTWHQKASRAFAAELLVPQEALMNRLGPSADASPELVDDAAHEFRVSAMVVQKQLENAGASLQGG